MGEFDDISGDRLRADLVRLAELILRMEREGTLLASPARIQRLLGTLRQKLFAWEVRASPLRAEEEGHEDGPQRRENCSAEGQETRAEEPPDPQVLRSLQVVEDALRRQRELEKEWRSGPDPGGGDGD
jgi:hypothetical protein